MRNLASWFAETGGDQLPLSGLGQLGAVGGVLAILFWFAWQVYKRERDRADKNEAEIARLNQVIQDKYVPSLESAAVALAESNRLLARYQDDPPRRRN